ncbi:(d)CMP kinase [Candidatus Woesebacteria bacterium]|nr:(d)CMP kinase [Candidatus Woesebacteria bacterium]
MAFQIAIDGPVAAGKGTVAWLVAKRLGFLYVDTGAMYRATAYLAAQKGIEFDDEAKIVAALKQSEIELRNPLPEEQDGRLTTVLLDGLDVSWKIRTSAMGSGGSDVSALAGVRSALVAQQQSIAASQNVVIEGRDIAIRVLPHAQLKYFLTANELVRAKRRQLELQTHGQDVPFSQVLEQMLQRDYNDSHRKVDPLQVTDEHILIDTSDLGVEKVVDLIVTKAKMMMDLNHDTNK